MRACVYHFFVPAPLSNEKSFQQNSFLNENRHFVKTPSQAA